MIPTRTELVRLLLLVVLAAVVTFAIECHKPVNPDGGWGCGGGCLVLNKEDCVASGRTYIEGGAICHCDICVKRVGEYERCNYTVYDNYDDSSEIHFGQRQTTVLCNLTLVCTKDYNGVCADPNECEWV